MERGSSQRGRTLKATAVIGISVAAALTVMSTSPAGSQAGSAPIIASHSFKVMDVLGASKLPATPIVQWTHNDGSNQQWTVRRFSTIGSLDLVLIQSVNSGQVLDVSGGSTASGAELVQNPWSAALSQLWIPYPLGDTGYDILFNVKSGMVADVGGASQGNGAPVIQWAWNGGKNQIWLVPAPVTTTPTSGPTTSSTGPTSSTTTSTQCDLLRALFLGGC
ncbi:MAG: RICIN domain-containing protein [Actinomycetota bacterium]|nr:RICIN domain-containing protein [Actinomycetota bacterium]